MNLVTLYLTVAGFLSPKYVPAGGHLIYMVFSPECSQLRFDNIRFSSMKSLTYNHKIAREGTL